MKQALNTFTITPLNGSPGATRARLAADVPFTATTGEHHPAGNASQNYVEYDLTVSGDGQIFPTANGIDSTTDSTDPNATYTMYLIDIRGKEIGTLFERWMFDASFGPSVLWTELEARNSHRIPLRDDQVYSKMQVDNLLLNRTFASPATTVSFGVVRITGPSSTVVSTDDPRMVQLEFLPTLLAKGTHTLVASGDSITAPLVTADSPIQLIPASDSIQGNLHVINRVPGVGFDVYSTEGGDAGSFVWLLYDEL